ncbi:MAG: glutamate--tRNA ligase [Armatimonadota bacterium]
MGGQVRVRFAPSPTGALHVGGVRTALFNWLFARKHGGAFVLRIEDTDEARSTEESLRGILEGFRWVGLDWDEGPDVGGPFGPYVQSERLDLYEPYFEKLLAEGKAYACYCTPEELAERRKQMAARGVPPRYDGRCRRLSEAEGERLAAQGRLHCLRFRMPEAGTVEFEDLVHGVQSWENSALDDFVVRKSSGFPTYNFACVVDDALMAISHVVRAEQHLSNTPRQVHLAEALGFEPPVYAHVSHVLAPDRSKLSKRHGATDINEFRELGYLPEAMLNFLVLLGWSTGDEQEIMSREELIQRFDLARAGKSGAVFDATKLEWMNGQYINGMALAALAERTLPVLQRAGLMPAEPSEEELAYLREVLELMQERLKTLNDLPSLGGFFFSEEVEPDEKARRKWLSKDWAPEMLTGVADALERLPDFTVEAVEAAVRGVAKALGRQAAEAIHPTRAAVSGMTMGPSLFHMLVVLGPSRVIPRLRRAAAAGREGAYRAAASGGGS